MAPHKARGVPTGTGLLPVPGSPQEGTGAVSGFTGRRHQDDVGANLGLSLGRESDIKSKRRLTALVEENPNTRGNAHLPFFGGLSGITFFSRGVFHGFPERVMVKKPGPHLWDNERR